MTPPQTALVLGGTGKTGRRIVQLLGAAGVDARPASRSGGAVRFDWADRGTYANALSGAETAYMIPPANRLDPLALVRSFLDEAERAGLAHVTYLSARGIDKAPAEVPLRGIELDLARRTAFTHSILRPAWFMQNFSEDFLLPDIVDRRLINAPAGQGAEAFIDAGDIAAVAAATLLDPGRHGNQAYTLTGPAALTLADVAEVITATTGQTITYRDIDTTAWIDATVASGTTADRAARWASLFDNIRAGRGAATTDDVARVLGREPTAFADFARLARTAWPF